MLKWATGLASGRLLFALSYCPTTKKFGCAKTVVVRRFRGFPSEMRRGTETIYRQLWIGRSGERGAWAERIGRSAQLRGL